MSASKNTTKSMIQYSLIVQCIFKNGYIEHGGFFFSQSHYEEHG